MKGTILALALAALVTNALHAQQSAAPPKDSPPAKAEPSLPALTGKWDMALDMVMGQSTPLLTLKQDGEKLTGTYQGRYGTFPLEGTLKGRAVEFWLTMTVESEKVEMSFKGEVAADGQSMRGAADLGQAGEGNWTAAREKEK
jgi:hypothetical protein